jgi:transcriptional antiterminator RfaH
MQYWYAINTKMRSESQAYASLSRLGVEVFLPMLRDRRMARGANHTAVVPLFPGYLFARFQASERYRAVTYAKGVKGIVSFGSVPSIVDDSIIEAIRCRECDGVIEIDGDRFSPGQVVRIHEGPLLGLEAVFEKKLSGATRAVLLLKALSFQAHVIIGSKQVANF